MPEYWLFPCKKRISIPALRSSGDRIKRKPETKETATAAINKEN